MIKINLTNAAPVALTCKRGDTFIFDGLDFWSDTAETIPIDISADDFKMEVKDEADAIILTFVSPTNFTVSGTGDNHLKITMPATDMEVAASPNGQPYKFDLQWTDSTNIVRTVMKGTFTIENDVTDNA